MMNPNQIDSLRRIRRKLDNIRGNEEEVKDLKNEVDVLLNEEKTLLKSKIDSFSTPVEKLLSEEELS